MGTLRLRRRAINGFLYLAIPIACSVSGAVALKCLQCMDPAPNGPCRHDIMTQVNTSLGIFPNNSNLRPYYKDCNDGRGNAFQNNCVIEEFYTGGLIKSFIRDCSDGVTFSFSEKLSNNSKLTQIAPDNFTTCIYDLGTHYHICVTLCSGDFCNAPRKPPKNLTCVGQGGNNTTCSAPSTMMRRAQGLVVFGSTLDAVLGQYFLLPFFVSLVCALLVA